MKKSLYTLTLLITSFYISENASANYQVVKHDIGDGIYMSKNMEPSKKCSVIKDEFFTVNPKDNYTDVLREGVKSLGGNYILIREYGFYSNKVGGTVYSCPKE